MSWLSSFLGEDAAKNSQDLSNQAVTTAQGIYNGLDPYRTAAGSALLTQPTTASLATLYGNNPQYTALSDPTLTGANAAATTSLNNLTTAAPDYEAEAMQTLKDFQTAAQPQLAAGIKSIDQAAGETGRVGAEGVTTSLGDLATTYANNLQSEEDTLASDSTAKQFAAEQAAEQAAQSLSNLTYGQDSDQQKLALATGEQGIQNTESELGQQLNRGLSLAQLGYSNSPVGAYQTGSQSDADAAAAAAKGAGALGQGLGSLALLALG